MIDSRLNYISQTIFDKKGLNIVALDVRGVSTVTDYFLIAEGTSDRHVQAICQDLIEKMKENGFELWYKEGMQGGLWVVLDFGDIIIHVFGPGLRDLYRLEALWKQGKIIDVDLEVNHEE